MKKAPAHKRTSSKQLHKRISEEYAYIASEQTRGYFQSVRYTLRKDSCYEITHTTYYTSLILCMLSTQKAHPIIANIARNGIEFLKNEINEHSLYNYHVRCTKNTGRFPADLDDTSLALAAFFLHTPTTEFEHILYDVVHVLMKNETTPGGPYFTWVVPKELRNRWSNIDIAVNAHIAYFLSLHDIHLTQLTAWIDDHIEDANLTSEFYLSPITLLYCITRAYSGKRNAQILKLLKKYQSRIHNPLLRALYTTAHLRAGGDPRYVQTHVRQLLAVSKTKLRKPYPFFIEEKTSTATYISGCHAFTSAAFVEALSEYETHSRKRTAEHTTEKYRSRIMQKTCEIIPHHLQGKLLPVVHALVEHDARNEIILVPYYFHHTLVVDRTGRIPSVFVENLACANILGWVGYTLLDDAYDDEQSFTHVPSIHYAVTQTRVLLLESAFTEHARNYIHRTLTDTHDTLEKERRERRCSIEDHAFLIPEHLEPLQTHTSLHKKSFGHALGPLLILLRAGYEHHSPEFTATEHFFRTYLTARQLNDDAHDVCTDLERGHISSTVAMLLMQFIKEHPERHSIHTVNDMPLLKQIFWTKCIGRISKDILVLCENARNHLAMIPLNDPTYFISLLEPLEHAARKALSERDATLRFLAIYNHPTP